MRISLSGFVLAAALAATTVAQQPGDLYVTNSVGPGMLSAPRGGFATSLVAPSFLQFRALTNGPGDGSVYALATTPTAILQANVLRVTPQSATTLSSLFSTVAEVADVALDDGGDLLLLNTLGVHGPGLLRMPLVPNAQATLVAPMPVSRSLLIATAEDVDTGEWWMLDSSGALHRARVGGPPVLAIAQVGVGTLRAAGLAVDPDSGDVWIAAGMQVFRYRPSAPLSTLFAPAFPPGGGEILGVQPDPFSPGVLTSMWETRAARMFGLVHEIDRNGVITATTNLGVPIRPERVVAAWGRAFTATVPPVAGSTYTVRLQSRPDPGARYQVALATASRPGIPTPIGRIPLRIDPLLQASLAPNPLFVGFAGALDAGGAATIAIRLPAGTRGFRAIAAAVTFDATGLRRILGPFGFTVR